MNNLTQEQQTVVDAVCKRPDKIVAVNAIAGSGKGLEEHTGVLTRYGYIEIKDLKVGDKVINSKGTESNVIGVFKRGYQNCYKLTFSNNYSVICDEDHLWTYQTKVMRDQHKGFKTSSMKDLAEVPVKRKSGKYEAANIYLPMLDTIEFSKEDNTNFDMYILGVLLGDGCFQRSRINFSNSEDDIIESVKTYVESIGDKFVKQSKYDYRINGGHTLNHIRYLGLDKRHSVDKEIPLNLTYGSVNTRLQILRGLIDTDGSVMAKSNGVGSSYEYSTSSPSLAEDVMFIAESLGCTVHITFKENPSYVYNGEQRTGKFNYRLVIKPGKNTPKLHTSVKHENRWNPKPQAYARITIDKIEKLNTKFKTVCIKVDSEDELFVIEHCILTHNTSTCHGIIKAYQPKYGFYTAFNVGIVKDSDKKFGNLIPCKTIHSLAYNHCKPRRQIRDLIYSDIDLDLSIKEKIDLINNVDSFYRSRYDNIDDFIENENPDSSKDDILYVADLMLNDKLNPTFSFLLKKFHLMLLDKVVEPHYELFILDECQDLNGVMFEIFKLIQADTKVMLGDEYQNIYSFMNTVNAFENISYADMDEYYLTKSFRCNPEIAEKVEIYGRKALKSTFAFKGNENLDHNKYNADNVTFLCKLNSSLIKLMYKTLSAGKTFNLIRSIDSIFEYPIALFIAASGKEVKSKKYKFLEDIYNESKTFTRMDFYRYLQKDEVNVDDVAKHTANVLEDLEKDGINIFDLKNKVSEMEKNPNLTLATAHSYKGLEADNILLYYDLQEAATRSLSLGHQESRYPDIFRGILSPKDKENLNLLYVAKSRARYEILENMR